jgi:hypothetical protein
MIARSTEVVAGLSDRLKVRRIIENSRKTASNPADQGVFGASRPLKPRFRTVFTLSQATPDP